MLQKERKLSTFYCHAENHNVYSDSLDNEQNHISLAKKVIQNKYETKILNTQFENKQAQTQLKQKVCPFTILEHSGQILNVVPGRIFFAQS